MNSYFDKRMKLNSEFEEKQIICKSRDPQHPKSLSATDYFIQYDT